MDNNEIKSVDDDEIKSVNNEENESIDNEETEIMVEKEIVDENNTKVKKTKKPVNKRKRVITIAAITVILILIGSVAAIWYIADAKSYVATVDGKRIPKHEYEYYLKQNKFNQEQQSQLQGTAEEKKAYWETTDATAGTTRAAVLKTNTLDFVYQLEILIGEAIKKDPNVLKTQKDITKKTIVDEYNSNKQSESDFVKGIKENYGISYAAFIDIRTKFDVASKYYTESIQGIVISDEEMQSYYNENKEAMDLITIKFSMYLTIDTNTGEPLSAEKIEIAKNKAEAALKKLQNGEDFDKLIEEDAEDKQEGSTNEAQFSIDPSSQQYFKDISDPLKTMAVNEYKLIEIEKQGYVVFQYIKRTTFDDLKDNIKTGMQTQEFEKIISDLSATKPLVENQKGKIIDEIDIHKYA